MQPIDGSYLYSLGGAVRPLSRFNDQTLCGEAWLHMFIAKGEVEKFLNESVFSPNVRTSRANANSLLQTLNELIDDAQKPENQLNQLGTWNAYRLSSSLSAFEAVLIAEFGMMPIFLITPKKGYDLNTLLYSGETLFPSDLASKVPAAIKDIRSGTQCLAFEAYTAAAFHFCRALESVVRAYWEAVMAGRSHPGNKTIGDYLNALRKSKKGSPKLKSALRDLKDLDRNPILHPEHFLTSIEDADAVLGKVKNLMSQMLLKIPVSVVTSGSP